MLWYGPSRKSRGAPKASFLFYTAFLLKSGLTIGHKTSNLLRNSTDPNYHTFTEKKISILDISRKEQEVSPP